jgi:ATP-dependent Clp protease ATP-binding subunit ClpA
MKWFNLGWKGRGDTPAGGGEVSGEGLKIFTPRAQQVLALARREADRFHHNFVGTEHLLLGLIKLGQGVAVNVLQKLGLDLETVRLEVEKQVGTGPEQKLLGNIPYTPRVKKVLALAAKEARALNHTYVGTEHILLGLLREGDGVAARVLRNLDVDIEQTRQEILKELDPNFAAIDEGTGLSPSQTTPIQPKSEKLQHVESPKSRRDLVDTSKRYDVYCTEQTHEVVVYRNALFKGAKSLLPKHQDDSLSEFVELEQADGQAIFIARYSIIKFCEPGVTPNPETARES